MDGKEADERGAEAERFIHELSTETFFMDWCYLNPLLPSGKELCDLLVVFDDVAIIWQIKNLKLHDGKYDSSEVERNLRQLAGARRQIIDLKTSLALRNPRRGIEQFDPSAIKQVFLISALVGEEQDISTLMQEYKGKKIHVIGRKFAKIALQHLDTITDFVQYLKDKEVLLDGTDKFLIHGGEEELLATYMGYGRSFQHLVGKMFVIVDEGSWNEYLSSERFQKWKQGNEITKGWDDIINRAHEAGGKYEFVAREMARLARYERRELSKAYLEAMFIAAQDKINNSVRRVIVYNSVVYCFLFLSSSFSIKQREELLGQLCFVARKKFGLPKIVGIGTEKELEPTCSYNFVLVYLPTLTDDLNRKIDEMQEKAEQLINPSMKATEAKEFD